MIRVATFNSPGRLQPHARDYARLAELGCVAIAGQENRDRDPKRNAPPGWKYYRPRGATSNVVYWDPAQLTPVKRGHIQVSSPGFPSDRDLVWVHFRTGQGPLRFASIHPPAFKTSRPRNAREFRRQEKRYAAWLAAGRHRVLAGDYNSRMPAPFWMPNLSRVAVPSHRVPSGPPPRRAPIDYVSGRVDGTWMPARTVWVRVANSDHRAVVVDLVRNR